ncbi:unnamed protein product [Tilletia controversa]|uniref:Adenosylmethionine decarboxylase n=1 Tax=Tilletia controversa TaxID=13291 RepID=A0A8X7MJX9_9BASI|nr:hypothetical protein CF328_g7749 [Tilletia controversa]KAE8239156.1 hypothetical protein A4X06_0g8480 [Tilletia controversa]CAD6896766.1 unnamed protein product [Tilletia controversa]CAD6901188.1 unnamed protein product [Tilletia controversa]CAD6910591.1 unnamed protein product [Tilletia controversa]
MVSPVNGPPADPSGPFEGPEKLLELWFRPSQPSPSHSLRSVDRSTWQTILDTVSCTILSALTHAPQQQGEGGPPCDAYLLSESSMFVFDHKLILKTCGTTTLLLGLEHILHLAHHVLALGVVPALNGELGLQAGSSTDARQGAQLVERVFYSRKSFMFPDRQKGPHKDWMLEVALLDDFFDDGAAYTVGKMNGDHWLLYMAGQDGGSSCAHALTTPAPLAAIQTCSASSSSSAPHNDTEDQTLEILMTHLDSSATQAFYFPPQQDLGPASGKQANGSVGHASEGSSGDNDDSDRGHALGAQTSASIGLASLFSSSSSASSSSHSSGQQHQLDAFAFEPCGYSANALIAPSAAGDAVKHTAGYWTVHVTPEPECSYASFETNVRFLAGSSADEKKQLEQTPHNLTSLIRRVVEIFQPGKMSITLFLSASDPSPAIEHTGSSPSPPSSSSSSSSPQSTSEAGTNAMALDALVLNSYRRTDRILYEFEGYDLTFVTFEHVGLGARKVHKQAGLAVAA